MSSSPALAIARLAALVLLSAALISASTLHSSSESSESSSAAASDLPRSSLGPGDYVFTLNRPEGPRTFRVRVPKSYAPAAPTPLLLAFHGLNDHCDKFDLKTGFLQLADQYGFLLVYPCSETGALGTAWNGMSFDISFTVRRYIYWASTFKLYFLGIILTSVEFPSFPSRNAAGTCCLGNATVDDNAFARGIVSFMQASFAVDSSRVWSSGFSNGISTSLESVFGARL